MTSQHFHIRIPVKPHVNQYLTSQYNNPYRLNQNDYIGNKLFTLMRKPVRDNRRIDQVERYPQKFTVVLSNRQVLQYGCKQLDANSVVLFNHEVDDMINQLFIAVMDSRTDLGDKYTSAIYYFMSRYDFYDMNKMNFEMLKRRYYRYRKNSSKNEAKKVPQLSLNF